MYFTLAQDSQHQWWKYVVTLLVTIFVYLIPGAIPLTIVIGIQASQGQIVDIQDFAESYNPAALGIDQNFGLILLLFPSVLGFFTLWFMIKYIHKRSNTQIVTAGSGIRFRRMITAAFIWLIMLITVEIFFAFQNQENYTLQFSFPTFLPLLLISIVFIPFQTWFEELLFRGYLLQGLGILFRYRFIALILTSVAFGMMHAFNPEVKEFGLISTMPYYIGFGLFTGLLVILDDGIELACGIHAINNIYSAVFVTYKSSVLVTPAIWSINKIEPAQMTWAFLVMATIFIFIFQKKYKWNDWGKLIRVIPNQNENR